MAADETEFVGIAIGKVVWGNRINHTGRAALTFSIDLRTGFYSLTDPDLGQLGHGDCRTLTATS